MLTKFNRLRINRIRLQVNPARDQLKLFPCPRSRLKILSRETPKLNITGFHLNRQPPSGQSRRVSGNVIAYRRRSPPRVRRHRAISPQDSSNNGCCLCGYYPLWPNDVHLSFIPPANDAVDMCDTEKLYRKQTVNTCDTRANVRRDRGRNFKAAGKSFQVQPTTNSKNARL